MVWQMCYLNAWIDREINDDQKVHSSLVALSAGVYLDTQAFWGLMGLCQCG